MIKTIEHYNLQGKTVLLRVDLNSNVKKGKVVMGERIKESAQTIEQLRERKAKIVILAHQGNRGKEDFLSLEQHAQLLNKYTKVSYIKDILGEQAVKTIKNLKEGEAILLDNIRFIKEEQEPTTPNIIVETLTPLCDYYINDAFSVMHREHTSIIGFKGKLPCIAGPAVTNELRALEKINLKNCLYILGGAKPESDIKLLKGNKTLVCGLFGQLCLVAQGKNLGYQNEYLKKATLIKGNYDEFSKKLKKKLKHTITPIDFVVEKDKQRKELSLTEFPNNYEIMDIGQKTIQLFTKEIVRAKAVYMKGPAGKSDDKRFAEGTASILKAIAQSKAYSVIGGGHLSDTIKASKIRKEKFNHISTSGGALLSYIAGEKLPGLKVLEYYKKKA